MKLIQKITIINIGIWGFIFLSVVSLWCFANAGPGSGVRSPALLLSVGSVAALLSAAFIVLPFWIIFKRAGVHPALSILILAPMVNLVMLYIIAFFGPETGAAARTAQEP